MSSQEYLKSILHYDELSGHLYWTAPCSGRVLGKRAGNLNKNGYRTICIDNKQYREHRIIWCLMTGKWPEKDIDHIGKPNMTDEEAFANKSDNRWCNLRECNESQNGGNRKKNINNKSGI